MHGVSIQVSFGKNLFEIQSGLNVQIRIEIYKDSFGMTVWGKLAKRMV